VNRVTKQADGNAYYRQDWVNHAACREIEDPSIFFTPERASGYVLARRTALAKSICAACPVLVPCRAYALKAREPDGVWGGLSAVERTVMRPRSVSPNIPAPPIVEPGSQLS